MALEMITSIANFIRCGADSTSSAKPTSWSRENGSEEANVIDAGKETTAGAQTTTDSRILTKSSEDSVSARNEKMADEDREQRKKKRTQGKKNQGKEKPADGNGNSAFPGEESGLQSSVLATGVGERSENVDTAARKPTQAGNVPDVLNEAPSDKQGTASFPEPNRSPSPEFVPEDWWIEMACDYWEMDEKEVLKIVFRANVTHDKGVNQQVSGGLFQPNKTTPAYLCGPTGPVSPAVCEQTNGLFNEEHSGQNYDLTTRPCRRIGGRRLKVKIAKFGRLPTIEEEPSVPFCVCPPSEPVVNETITVGKSTEQASGESNHETAEPFEFPVRSDNASLPAPENTTEHNGKAKAIKKSTTTRRKQPKRSDQEFVLQSQTPGHRSPVTPEDSSLFNQSSPPDLKSLGVANVESSDKKRDDEQRWPRLRSTLRRKDNLVAAQDIEMTDNAVEASFEATMSGNISILDMRRTKRGEVQPFQCQTEARKAREHRSQNWKSPTSTKTGDSPWIPTSGATLCRLVQPACQPHPPSLPAPGKRKNPRARRFVKPLARDQQSLKDKELAHRVGEDGLRLPDVMNSSGGRAMNPTKQRGFQVLLRIVQHVPASHQAEPLRPVQR